MTPKISFTTDASLGKLCKWLRILGFDARYERDVSREMRIAWNREGRWLLTRITALKDRPSVGRILFIRADDPFEQLQQVVNAMAISEDDIQPFTRCIRCNRPLSEIEKASAADRMPDYVWERVERVYACPGCGRIYWRGTHSRHVRERIQRIFGGPSALGAPCRQAAMENPADD